MLLLMHCQDGPFLQTSSSASKPSNPGLDACASPQSLSSSAVAPLSEERGDCVLLEAERDDSQTKGQASLFEDSFPSSNVRGDGQKESIVGDKDGGLMESTGDSTTVWSSLELDMNYGHTQKGESCVHCGSAACSFYVCARCFEMR